MQSIEVTMNATTCRDGTEEILEDMPESSPAEVHESRAYLLYHRTRLWCRECENIHTVTDFRPLSKTAVLQCGHSRSLNLGES